MSKSLDSVLEEYHLYADMFALQIAKRSVWSEQTGCELEEVYEDYVNCCNARLYDFGTWYEHSFGEGFPSEPAWAERREYRAVLVERHPV